MPTPQKIERAVQSISDFDTFFHGLLAETLDWPISQEVEDPEDIGYGWTSEELRANGLDEKLIDGQVWQIQPLPMDEMSWGIFLLEFENPEVFIKGRGMVGLLRRVLRGLVPSRLKDPHLPSWDRENILFIATHGWERFTFAHFRKSVNGSRIPRLASFGWAPGTSNRTLYEYNLPPLVWPEDHLNHRHWLRTWTSAFDKEKLTKDFFKRFDRVLELIKKDLEEYQKRSSAEAYAHAQLLLERMLFLYFVQNRGWLNQDRKFLINGFEDHKHFPDIFTYYEKFLDVLFWSLSSPPGSSANRMPGVPFLNGGLFDDDDFRQPANLRKINPPLKVKNATFERVFDELLEAFNFTVTEDTPLDQEVAVDPEMLGKVFESIVLHAEAADPEARAPDKRKATGSYYTPRIVVHFICREALFQHLVSREDEDSWRERLKILLEMNAMDGIDADEMNILKDTIQPMEAAELLKLVKGLKCCDPAVGSGAFSVGLLHELVNLRRILQTAANGYRDPVVTEGAEWTHDTKADIIENCLYGVDIQQQAIEICRLRLWLSLVVDYDIRVEPFEADRSTFMKAIKQISHLPNLEMNFKRGDSLHDHISGVPVIIEPGQLMASHRKLVEEIQELGAKLHRARKSEQKRKLRIKILEKRLGLSERVIKQEIAELQEEDSALAATLFGETGSASEQRKRIAHEVAKLEEAVDKITEDRQKLEILSRREFDPQFYIELRRLEGADFDSPFNFAWRLDFPTIFTGKDDSARSGFDIIVGNPPFVTARNRVWRGLWRRRWAMLTPGKYQLVSPFFNLGFDILKAGGQLGYIVSNAFTKREFGQPLIEDYFPKLTIQKVVDCSGLMFPGHGTPTCIVLGKHSAPLTRHAIRVTGILPGGGDLRTPPEESPLWHTIAFNHDRPGYQDTRICVKDRPLSHMAKWPWSFDHGSAILKEVLEDYSTSVVSDCLLKSIGLIFDTHAKDIFTIEPDVARRCNLLLSDLSPLFTGENIRDWTLRGYSLVLRPYTEDWDLINLKGNNSLTDYLELFRVPLGSRITFAGPTYDEEGRPWYEYHQLDIDKIKTPEMLVFPFIATHTHSLFIDSHCMFDRHGQIIKLHVRSDFDHHLLSGLLNSNTALFWLKQVCFNRRLYT